MYIYIHACICNVYVSYGSWVAAWFTGYWLDFPLYFKHLRYRLGEVDLDNDFNCCFGSAFAAWWHLKGPAYILALLLSMPGAWVGPQPNFLLLPLPMMPGACNSASSHLLACRVCLLW